MARSALRHQVNALLCALVAAHAVYWFVSGGLETATTLRTSLVVAQAILGVIGVIWFLRRSRRAPS